MTTGGWVDIQSLSARYQRWVTENPDVVGDTEAVLKWISYAIAGYVNKSVILSELLYSAANLVSFINDRILANKFHNVQDAQYSRMEYLLSTIETLEIFLELAAGHVGGPVARWAVIASIQVLKTLLRLVLLVRAQRGMRRMLISPVIPPLDRQVITRPVINVHNLQGGEDKAATTFSLRRSGRIIRTVGGAPPSFRRDWTNPTSLNNEETVGQLSQAGLVAECLHIAQPLVHLAAMGVFGHASWKPLILSLVVDCSSSGIHAMESSPKSRQERRELLRRRINLLLYLLRSPMYDKTTKNAIVSLFNNVPFGKRIGKAIQRHINEYQSIYLYIW